MPCRRFSHGPGIVLRGFVFGYGHPARQAVFARSTCSDVMVTVCIFPDYFSVSSCNGQIGSIRFQNKYLQIRYPCMENKKLPLYKPTRIFPQDHIQAGIGSRSPSGSLIKPVVSRYLSCKPVNHRPLSASGLINCPFLIVEHAGDVEILSVPASNASCSKSRSVAVPVSSAIALRRQLRFGSASGDLKYFFSVILFSPWPKPGGEVLPTILK